MTVILFDVDGTLTLSGDIIREDMIEVIRKLSLNNDFVLGIVGGGNYQKILWQLGTSIKYFKYIFAECGAVVYVNGQLVMEKNMLQHCDRNVLNKIIKKALHIISQMPIIYHGQQIDFRKGLVYISPPGMQATNYEREYFLKCDATMNLRKNLLDELILLDRDCLFEIVYGGSVGIAVYPKRWNKSQVIDYLKNVEPPTKIYYFGDRTDPDGNDFPIYSHPLVNGISVSDYYDTVKKINQLFFGNEL